MVRATGDLCDAFVLQVGDYQHWCHALISCSIAQLAVAIVAPGIQISI